MSVAIVSTPSAPTAVKSVTRVDVSGAAPSDLAAYDAALYPTAPENRFYLAFLKGATEVGRSYVFGVDAAGAHQFNSYIWPEAGSCSIELRLASNNSVVQTQAVTVS